MCSIKIQQKNRVYNQKTARLNIDKSAYIVLRNTQMLLNGSVNGIYDLIDVLRLFFFTQTNGGALPFNISKVKESLPTITLEQLHQVKFPLPKRFSFSLTKEELAIWRKFSSKKTDAELLIGVAQSVLNNQAFLATFSPLNTAKSRHHLTNYEVIE